MSEPIEQQPSTSAPGPDQAPEMAADVRTEPPQPEPKARLKWFIFHLRRRGGEFARRHRWKFGLMLALAIALLWLCRGWIQPLFIGVRIRFLLLAVVLAVVWMLWILGRRGGWKSALAACVGAALLILGVTQLDAAYQYVALYYRYRTLVIHELKELPTTDHERIQPLNSVFSLAHEVMTESESPMSPDFVRVGDEYRWTVAIEPAYPISRLFGGVNELFNVSATAPSPNFGRANREKVKFLTGENLLLGRNARTATIKSFGAWRYLNYEPSEVTYIRDDEGEWMQVVSLIRWRGLLFPRPEFGGVNLIRQEAHDFRSTLRLFLWGAGEWIRPDQIANHRFLDGQNLVPFSVSRYAANSFRFHSGFWAPFPGYHRGDIRIPDLSEDVNDQPFTTFFRLPGRQDGKLFQYFALEPFDPEKQGLNTSLLVQADGRPEIYVFRHHELTGSLTGVSAISAKVMESRKQYDWSRNRPVEHRPFIRVMRGRPRFFWMTTVVTQKSGENRFIAGSVPDVVLTDATYNTPVWVNPLTPEKWTDQIERELGGVWDQ